MGKKSGKKKARLAESVMQFQIEVRSKEMEELKEEVRELEDKNQKLIELQDQLQEEQQRHISVLRKQAKEHERLFKEKEVANKEQVEQAVQQNQELRHIQEEELEELHRQLTSVQAQVEKLQVQRQAQQLFENMGSVDQQQIQKLQSELYAVQKNVQAISENIECCLKETICKIDKKTSQLVEREKQLAGERTLKQVDKNTFQNIEKNDWLKKVLVIYDDEVSELDVAVRNLEEENLEHMKQLFEHCLSVVQISSNVFLTQAEDLEQKLRLLGRPAETGKEQHHQSGELEEDETDHSCKPSSPTHHLRTLLDGNQSDLNELLHLGLLEQRLMSVVSQPIPLCPLPSDPVDLDTLTHLGLIQTQNGSVTANIIRKKFQ
ncbi:coiled-coil domain-containing protein 83 [Neoarius graeffei]|uniref:coiled-coil domain-containing protein 83 n=1 Tax=Neoarius graeffei TaxID=443677 RepID=UPI00298C8AAF|nr:coiled-coil domain-containing protein 83 [Neoarius graeffei]